MEQLPTPHNNFFQFALSHLPNARNLIQTQLSEAALAELDLESLQLEAGSFIDADLRERFSDLLLSARLAKCETQDSSERALIYFLFEHKSQSDPWTVFQLLSYIVRIWEKRLRDGLDLCPIIPLVVYHGEDAWAAAKSIQELIASPSGLGEYQVDFHFHLLDLSQLKDHEISGYPILQNTLRLLKYSRSRYLVGMLGEIMRLIARSLPENQWQEWGTAIGVYVMSVNKDIDEAEYKQTLKSIFPTQFEPGSLADRLLAKGREEGRQEGRQEGLQEGKLTGKIQLVQDLLGDKVSSDEELNCFDQAALTDLLAELQQRLRDR
jgi:predicted transposase YdaD